MTTRLELEQFLQSAYETEKDRFDVELEKARQQVKFATPLFGYFPARWMLDFAATCSFLYARHGQMQYVEQARQALRYYQDWTGELPDDAHSQRPEYADGIPPLEPVFQPVLFVQTVQNIRAALPANELENLADVLARTLSVIWRFPEWGGHNRAMLRAAGLAMAASAFPNHADANGWVELSEELAEESWGRWSIEDAMLYQPHWLRALILYASARGREAELIDMVQPRMHLKAMTQLISPLGILPDFGDSHWIADSHWEWTACLEWGAGVYCDPAMKWTAACLFEGRRKEVPSAHLAAIAALVWNWCDESIPERPPLNQDDALDDLVLKKTVWRTGWEPQASYALLNYRDEGDYGRAARDYLRTSLAVSAEKMHHGHADEGSFSMLVHQQTLLLHESGYREQPPDGMYRSAVYHNRLVWKSGRRPEGQALLDFLRGDGLYQPVRTERIYHTRLLDAAFLRVRTIDEQEGLSWDRSVIFLPDLPCWIVLDSVLSSRASLRTISSLWWTTDILEQGGDWFLTHIRGVQDWQNPKNAALLISMPAVPNQPGVLTTEACRRAFQDEIALTRTWTGEQRAGSAVNFVTVLWPQPYREWEVASGHSVEVVESQPAGRGVAVWLRQAGQNRLFGTHNDLAVGYSQEIIRPSYTAELGMTRYGPVSSDAAFVYLKETPDALSTGFINGTAFSYQNQVLYQGLPHSMFQEDGTARPGVPARFRWQTTIAKDGRNRST